MRNSLLLALGAMVFLKSASLMAATDTISCTVQDHTTLRSNEAPSESSASMKNAEASRGLDTSKNVAAPLAAAAANVDSGSERSLSASQVTVLEIFGDNQKRKVLRDARYSIQVAKYVGQVQIILVEAATRKNLVMVTSPDRSFVGLDLINLVPNVTVSCKNPSATNANANPTVPTP